MKKKHILKNKKLKINIKTKGAELASIKANNLEYLWQADPKIWAKHAPLLFPIVGRLVDHEYTFQGKTFPMKQHGFARDNIFEVLKKTKNSITFRQVSTVKSKKIYPFNFSLDVKYTLNNNKLITKYKLRNTAKKKELYFSIGAHPAFNCPFEKQHKRKEYKLVFDKKLRPDAQINNNGLHEGKRVNAFNKKGVIEIVDSLFDKDSIAFNPNPFDKVTFRHMPTQKKYLSVRFKDFPYLGIWSKPNTAPFVCIEPWYGIADEKNHNKDFTKKEGVMKLAAGKNFSCAFTIEIHL